MFIKLTEKTAAISNDARPEVCFLQFLSGSLKMLRPALTRTKNLQKMTQQELIARISDLERCLQAKTFSDRPPMKGKAQRTKRSFNFHEYPQRRIALKIAYFGWEYHGFAAQENALNTVEEFLFDALHTARLIADRGSADYNRCGRTDKGVSAVSQVVALNVRSEMPLDHPDVILSATADPQQVKSKYTMADWREDVHELQYHQILNRILPPSIRVLSWCPVQKSFSARFDCVNRKYKYFFAKEDLDIEAMKTAASYLIGPHDFRNFCKIDLTKGGQQCFDRTIMESYLEDLGDGWYCYNIKGSAFLWHQVRCIMAILFLVGQRKESTDIVKQLLDIERVREKPQYLLASEIPLVLWDCEYKPALTFKNTMIEQDYIIRGIRESWKDMKTKCLVMENLFGNLMRSGHSSTVRVPQNSLPAIKQLQRFGAPRVSPETWLEARNAEFGDQTEAKWEDAEAFFNTYGEPIVEKSNGNHYKERPYTKLLEANVGCEPLEVRLARCDARIARKRQRRDEKIEEV